MSLTIWKSPLENTPVQVIKMPRGAKILSVGLQVSPSPPFERPHVWYLCHPDTPLEDRIIGACVTGGDGPDVKHAFLGTLQFKSGYVLHIFERFS